MIVLGYTGFTRDSRLAKGIKNPFAKTNLDFETLFNFHDGEVPFSMFPLSYLGHDASAALVIDGQVIAAAAEERFTRTKHSLNMMGNTLLPRNAIKYCLDHAGIKIADVDLVAHYCDFTPATISRRLDLLRPYISLDDSTLVDKSFRLVYDTMMSHDVVREQFEGMMGTAAQNFIFVPHHQAHAASAYYPSGFDDALILTLDGTGELESSLLALGHNEKITEIRRTHLPTSLGTLYLLITVFLGFKSLGDEYKVMGLSGYGDPARYRDFFRSIVRLEKGGDYSTASMTRSDFKELLLTNLGTPRRPTDPIETRHQDIAAGLQEILQVAVLHTLEHARSDAPPSLCLAGGVALNCLLNGAIARSGLFKHIFVQPAASDEGCSVGAALYGCYQNQSPSPVTQSGWNDVSLGPEYDGDEILAVLSQSKDILHWEYREDIADYAATEIARGQVIGWFQGRMEFGPRALGNRSILADPRDPGMKDRINAKIKRREAFRPFAPSVLEDDASDYFDLLGMPDSAYMLFAVPVKPAMRDKIPSVTHIDGTARVQTVSQESNPRFWDLISSFKRLTGVPVVLNTSFNVRDEPIVCTPRDAVQCFLSTQIDAMAIGDYYVCKRDGN